MTDACPDPLQAASYTHDPVNIIGVLDPPPDVSEQGNFEPNHHQFISNATTTNTVCKPQAAGPPTQP